MIRVTVAVIKIRKLKKCGNTWSNETITPNVSQNKNGVVFEKL
jgi:hypothetical protein